MQPPLPAAADSESVGLAASQDGPGGEAEQPQQRVQQQQGEQQQGAAGSDAEEQRRLQEAFLAQYLAQVLVACLCVHLGLCLHGVVPHSASAYVCIWAEVQVVLHLSVSGAPSTSRGVLRDLPATACLPVFSRLQAANCFGAPRLTCGAGAGSGAAGWGGWR